MTDRRSRASSAFSPSAPDDFKLIKGIGPAVEHKLHKAGIVTYAQLAALSANQIAVLLGRMSAKRVVHENWAGQAKQLAEPSASKTGSKKTGMPTRHNRRNRTAPRATPYATFTVELLLDEAGHVRRAVCAHHQSKDQETWNMSEWNAIDLVNYMLRKTGLSPLQAPEGRVPAQLESMGLATSPSKPISPESNIPPVVAQTPSPPIDATSIPAPDSKAAGRGDGSSTKNTPVEAERTRAARAPKAGSWESLRLSALTATPTNQDRSSRLFAANAPFRAQLIADLTDVKKLPDIPLDLVTNVFAKSLGGGPHQLVGQARDVAKLGDTAEVQVDCAGLPLGEYRLEAEVSLIWHSGGPHPSSLPPATLVSTFLHIY